MDRITIGHGSGGRLTGELVRSLFMKHITSAALRPLEDAAYIRIDDVHAAITTDSYVIRPLFFAGGDIGKLSVCGAINDMTVSGALPEYLSIGCIIEEGFPMESLEEIITSVGKTADDACVSVVAGDTKVVEKGKGDGLYINTTAVGRVLRQFCLQEVRNGDRVIVTGDVGDHGIAVALSRERFDIKSGLESDCAPLNYLLRPLFEIDGVRWMRDPTRGGLATVLAEFAESSGLGVEVREDLIPIRKEVRFISDMLGYDPLYIANEGKAVIITSGATAEEVTTLLQRHPLGKKAAIIGEISSAFTGARLRTGIGGLRTLDLLTDEMLPRIC